MKTEWKPEKYEDEYRGALMTWIQKKAKSGGMPAAQGEAEEAPEPGIINISDLLEQSLRKKKAQPSRAASKHKPQSTHRRKSA